LDFYAKAGSSGEVLGVLGDDVVDKGVLNDDMGFVQRLPLGVKECSAGPLYSSNCLHIGDVLWGGVGGDWCFLLFPVSLGVYWGWQDF